MAAPILEFQFMRILFAGVGKWYQLPWEIQFFLLIFESEEGERGGVVKMRKFRLLEMKL